MYLVVGRSHCTRPRDRRCTRHIPCRATWERYRGSQEAKDSGLGGSLYWEARQGRVSRLGLASLNNFGGFWITGVVPSCLALALG